MNLYLDSAACVKLFVKEKESEELSRALKEVHSGEPNKLFVSDLTILETNRALKRRGLATALSEELFRACDVIPVTNRILGLAAEIRPLHLKTLDAIHLASSVLLHDAISAWFVTCDRQLGAAARAAGLTVLSPGY